MPDQGSNTPTNICRGPNHRAIPLRFPYAEARVIHARLISEMGAERVSRRLRKTESGWEVVICRECAKRNAQLRSHFSCEKTETVADYVPPHDTPRGVGTCATGHTLERERATHHHRAMLFAPCHPTSERPSFAVCVTGR
jgi:hypothetical protein